jgi:hypothetical protein
LPAGGDRLDNTFRVAGGHVIDPGEPPPLSPPNLTAYPRTVGAAAILWIIVGTSALLNACLVVVAAVSEAPGTGEVTSQIAFLSAIVSGLFQAVVGGVFLYEGVESFRGTIPSTVPISVGSVLLALILVAVVLIVPETARGSHPAVLVVLAAGLLVAGVLGLLGGNHYERWWKARSRSRVRRLPD